ncbi:spore germination protein [Ectobacillus ponti]|uniref:Spore germination protein n=1 Tax=Ectobacillus ponti TaxID=2961894 RepID=A0AA42BNN7_9BACI|nr:spore germination protein [Ectobacillus ponti]MCP8968185.1 spore germination protein [Ectobacillus ponti]
MYALPKENRMVSAYFAFYLVHKMQIGVGILGFERYIAKLAGYDAWIGIILAGLATHLLLWLAYQILKKGNNDLAAIHHDVLGKWIGGLFSIYFILYFSAFALTLLRTYVEVIQVWLFPEINAWVLTGILSLLAYSFVTGGLRVVTGFCFLGIVYTMFLLPLKYFPIQEGHLYNMFPPLDHTLPEILDSAKGMALNYLGFELIMVYYPFLKNKEKSQKWAQLGVAASVLVYLFTALVTFSYFNQGQLKETIWATLTLWKIVDFPFLERFEYMGISIWLFGVLPNICLTLWGASRTMHRLFPITQRRALQGILLIVFCASCLMESRRQVDTLNNTMSLIGLYTIPCYFLLLYIWQAMIYKVRKKAHG